jgi:hypothetical protein
MKNLRLAIFIFTPALLFLAGVGIGSHQTSASAHTASTYYSSKWTNDPPVAFGRLYSPLDNEQARTSMRYYSPWNSVSGSTLDFSWSGIYTSVATWNGTACSSGLYSGYVWIFTHDISPLGFTALCLSGSTINRVAIVYDHTRSTWYTGSSSSVPAGRYDLRSVAVHEFGHAGGFQGHFTGSSICTGYTRQTMCGGLPSATSYKRTLASHDIHTVANAY